MKTISLILFFCFISMLGWSFPYWVSSTGEATWGNAESESPLLGTACCTLATANTNADDNNIVNLRAGTYNTRIEPSNSGTSGNVITFQAYNSESVIITNTPALAGAIHLDGNSYIKIDGIEVSTVYRLVEIEGGSHYNEIVNCTLHGGSDVANSGVIIRDLAGIANTHNWIHNCTIYQAGYVHPDTCNDSSNLMKVGVYNLDYVSGNNTIEDNVFYWGGHHVLETYTEKNVIRNNIFHNECWMEDPGTCEPTGAPCAEGKFGNRNIQIYDGNSRAALYNLVEGNRIGHAGEPPDGNGANNLVIAAPGNIARFNTIYNAGEKNVYLKQGTGADGENNRIYNNTCYVTYGARPSSYSMFFADASDNNVVKNNIFHSGYDGDVNTLKIPGNTYENNWETTDGDPKFVNTILSNPISTTLPDLSLQHDSPCLNGGTYLTQANGSGSDITTLIVDDALFFQDGSWGSSLATLNADWIAIGTVDNIVEISSINYGTNTIILATQKSWSDAASIWLYKDSDGSIVLRGSAPNYGAYQGIGESSTATDIRLVMLSSVWFTEMFRLWIVLVLYSLLGYIIRRLYNRK